MMLQWWLRWLAIGWVLVPAAASAQAAEMRTAGDQSPDLAAVVERLLSRTNAFRQQEGRPPVAPNPQFAATARDFATFRARSGQLTHTTDGQTPADRAKAHGYDPCLIAENIASQHHPAGFTTDAMTRDFRGPAAVARPPEESTRPGGDTNQRWGRPEPADRCVLCRAAVRPSDVPGDRISAHQSHRYRNQYAVDGRSFPLPPRTTVPTTNVGHPK